MSQKKQRILWWIFISSFLWIWIIWLIVSFIFYMIPISAWESSLLAIKNLINYLLLMFWLLSLILWIPLGIVFLVKWYRNINYEANIKLETNEIELEKIYNSKFDVFKLSKEDLERIKEHGFKNRFSPALAIFLNIITLWLFWFFNYGFKHDYLPIIKKNDFWWLKAIWFMFIPLSLNIPNSR